MLRKILVLVSVIMALLAGTLTYAAFHLWTIQEVFSNADGSIQFIELRALAGGQQFLNGAGNITVTSGAQTQSYTFPNDLPGDTSGRTMLLGTQGFANLGVVTPDYIIPDGFVFTSNVTLNFLGNAIGPFGSIPTDGSLSIDGGGATAVNSPRNFAGQSGTVVLGPSSTPPGAPIIGAATPGNGSASIAFSPPTSDGGSAITGYTATCNTGPFIGSGGGSPITVNGLSNGTTYSCSVTATNARGTGPASGSVNVTPSAPVTLPGAPSITQVSPGIGSATVFFNPPASNGGGTINNYIVTCGGSVSSGQSSPVSVFGIPNGSTVSCSVAAVNSAGRGPDSTGVFVTLPNVPGAPTINSVTPGVGSASVSFSAPASDGGSSISGYTATCGSQSASGGASPLTVTGLAAGGTFTCTVLAFNAVGNGPSSAGVGVTLPNVPGAPTVTLVTPGIGTATVAFNPPASNGGAAITSYRATCGALFTTGGASPLTVSGLTNGNTYTCAVTATNAVGTGPAGSGPAVTLPNAPAAPTNVVATPGDTQATLNFTAPANGGSAITGYSASCIPGPVTASSATTSINVTGLSNGTNYSCTVTATNAVGPGPASSPVSVRPAALPGAPIITSTVAGDAQASIFFTPPASNGGAPISGYSASCGVGGAAPFTTASGAFSPITVASLLNGSTYQCTVSATNVSGTGLPSVAASVTPTNAPTLTLLFAASRKTHGAAGACDIVIDAQQTVTQSVTVEPRIAGAAHTVYFRFNAAVLNAGSVATFDSLGGAIGSPSSVAAGNDVVVTLSGIPDKSRVRIALTGVNGGTDVEASMGFLVADISDSRSVSSADISGVKARQGQTLDPSNCRFDLNTSGTISAQDTSVVKSRAGATLP